MMIPLIMQHLLLVFGEIKLKVISDKAYTIRLAG